MKISKTMRNTLISGVFTIVAAIVGALIALKQSSNAVNIENTGDGVNQIGVVEGNVRIDSSASTKSSQSDHSNGSE